MKNLRTVLFEETLYALNHYMELKKEYGEWDNLVDIQHAKFCSLYRVIEESGLEEEYQMWKHLQDVKTQCQITSTVKYEVKQALESLGYKDFQFEIATASFHRLIVWVDDERIGIYDMDKHTFVD